MSSEIFDDLQEIDTRPEFAMVLAAADQCFQQAVDLHQMTPYRHVLITSDPVIEGAFGAFLLADNYSRVVEGEAEILKVAVPLEESDTENPVSVLARPDKGFFVLTYHRDGTEYSRMVDATLFDQEFSTKSAEPAVAGLLEKLLSFQIIPFKAR